MSLNHSHQIQSKPDGNDGLLDIDPGRALATGIRLRVTGVRIGLAMLRQLDDDELVPEEWFADRIQISLGTIVDSGNSGHAIPEILAGVAGSWNRSHYDFRKSRDLRSGRAVRVHPRHGISAAIRQIAAFRHQEVPVH